MVAKVGTREKGKLEAADNVCRLYTARDLENHFVRCAHRMTAAESSRVLSKFGGKLERNPMIALPERLRRMAHVQKRREWETRGFYPEEGQPLMDGYVRRRPKKGDNGGEAVEKRGEVRNKRNGSNMIDRIDS